MWNSPMTPSPCSRYSSNGSCAHYVMVSEFQWPRPGHFGLPPSSHAQTLTQLTQQKRTGLGGKIVWTMTYSHTATRRWQTGSRQITEVNHCPEGFVHWWVTTREQPALQATLGALNTWRSRDLRSAECASLAPRMLHSTPLQSVTGVWNLSKNKKKKKKKKNVQAALPLAQRNTPSSR